MKITKMYSSVGERRSAERKLFAQGFEIESEEEYKEFSGGRVAVGLLLFWPMLLASRAKRIKVTYIKEDNK